VGPIPMALARDWLGSYQLALSVLALLSLVLSGASLLVRPPAKASMT
jgi:hypothetical protein